MTKLTEDNIEQLALEQLQAIGYEYRHGSIAAPDSQNPERQNYSDVILKQRLSHAINTLNPHLPQDAKEQAFRTVTTINSPELINNMENNALP